MKKSFLVVLVLILGIGTSHAQLVQFGVKGGLNYANYTGGNVDGFDFNAMYKAYQGNSNGKRIKGGSTISQQTAKNVFLCCFRHSVESCLFSIPFGTDFATICIR